MEISSNSNSKMRRAVPRLQIAQVAPLYERIPPELYGGTERVVSYVTEELVNRGHDVTLFAAGDSETAAKLKPGCPQALRLVGKPELGVCLHLPMLGDLYAGLAGRFDIVHSHLDFWTFPFAELTDLPTLSTMHGRLDLPDLHPIYRRYRKAPLVSISDVQRKPPPFANWIATVYHGLPRDLLKFSPGPGKYLAFVGRISPEKRNDLAIDAALKAGIPFKMAAKVDAVDREYFEAVIKPRLHPPEVEYIGEISEAEKSEFLGNALALLFTIDWPEPFGLAMIEAMACGTPVISRPCGSVPEVVTPGLTGYIESSLDDLVSAIKKVDQLSREAVRREFEARFTAETMVDRYEQLYLQVMNADESTAVEIASEG
ncbi:MAG TPA: glycosyltransferase family 4 protein [Candidatus Binataceae bacterium]|nr:glycosyltransferase family 4 protein [Candidatus Binataceae bacterium]